MNMTSQQDEWEIQCLQELYHTQASIVLTRKQATQIIEYKNLRDTGSGKYYFSFWEEMDFEAASFRKILNDTQFLKYKKYAEWQINQHIKSLGQADKKCMKDIRIEKTILKYYEQEVLPKLEKELLFFKVAFQSEKTKIDFLKAEYKFCLDNSKRKILVEHFRHNKIFQPNSLALSLLTHQQKYFYPEYLYFKAQMDEATKAVADYFITKYFSRSIDLVDDILEKKKTEFENFKKEMLPNKEEPRGWHISINFSEQEQRESDYMNLLLLDHNKYK